MGKHYMAQLVNVKNEMVYKTNCNAKIKNGKIWLQFQNKNEKKYEIEHISNYSNEKLITIKEEFDFSFSMLMSFASAIFIQSSLVLSAILLSMALYDIYKKRNYKYVILTENANSGAECKLLNLLRNTVSDITAKKAA